MKEDDTIQIISKAFALRIIKLYQCLREEKGEFIISKQILRSGTSIGANARESINAESPLDFIHKLGIALKEANETQYWLELLHESGYINEKQFGKDTELQQETCKQIIKFITSANYISSVI